MNDTDVPVTPKDLGTCEALLLSALDVSSIPNGLHVKYHHIRCKRSASRVVEGPNVQKPGQLCRVLLCDYHAQSIAREGLERANGADEYGRPRAIPFREEHACIVIDTRDLIEADHDLHLIQGAPENGEEMTDMSGLVKKARAILRRLHDEAWEQSRLVQVGGHPCTARFVSVIVVGAT